MIIPFLIKHYKTIFEALIIAAVVVLFSLLDPFHWFSSKIKIKDTPVSVENIRQIGELITAEYYGEAIASLPQSYSEPIDSSEITVQGRNLYALLLTDLNVLKGWDKANKLEGIKVKEKNIEYFMRDSFPSLSQDKLYIPMLNFLKATILAKTKKKYDRKEILFKVYDGSPRFEGNSDVVYINSGFSMTGFYSYLKASDENKIRKITNNIVYLGRGWVKAGIDFVELKEENISYNEGNQTLYIRNCETRILDCDINPWFIPGKVKGYELLKEKGSFKDPFAEAVRVKKQCVENLRIQALKNGILEQAHKNATESLKNLFSLLTGTEIKEVIFSTNKFERVLNEIQKDKVVSDEEAVLIDEFIQNSLSKIDTLGYNDYRRQLADLRDFRIKIKSFQFSGMPINAYSLDLAKYLKNDTIQAMYMQYVREILSKETPCDSLKIKNAMFRLMANYQLSQPAFVDSCKKSNIIKVKSGVEHKLSGITKIYRDSIYSQCIQTCTATLQKPDNRYAIWFKTETEADSARVQIYRKLKKANPDFQLKSE